MQQARVVARQQGVIQSRLFSLSALGLQDEEAGMSYRRGRGGRGGYGQRGGRGGYGQRGGRGRGEGHPTGLRGRDIGMFFANKSREKKKTMDRNSVSD